MPQLVTDMDYRKNSTRVIKFVKKNGRDSIDFIPLSWTYLENRLLNCKYPDKKDYTKINKMRKTLSNHKESWKGFGISIISEASKYKTLNNLFTIAYISI